MAPRVLLEAPKGSRLVTPAPAAPLVPASLDAEDRAILAVPRASKLAGGDPRTRTVLLSLAGGAAGAGAGKIAMPKQGWKAVVGGAVVGFALPWIYSYVFDPTAKPKDPPVQAAESSAPLPTRKAPPKQRSLPAVRRPIQAQRKGQLLAKGWLGTLIAHGIAVQSKITRYMITRAHISFDKKLSEGDHGNVSEPGSLFGFAHAEFPPPVSMNEGFRRYPWRRWELWSQHYFDEYREEGWAIGKYYKDFCRHYGPGFSKSDKWVGFDNLTQYGLMPVMLGHQKIKYGGQGMSLPIFRDLWIRYHLNARWLVWAAEMLRIHSKNYALWEPTSQWSLYCAQWGIGCASRSRIMSRKTFDMGANSAAALALGQSKNYPEPSFVLQVQQALMAAVPPPGTLPAGTEIRKPRRLADWAPGAGRVRPAYNWPNTTWKKIIKAEAQAKYYDSFAYKFPMAVAKVSTTVAGSAVGGGLGAAVGGVVGALLERGVGYLFSLAAQSGFYSGSLHGLDFGQMALDIAQAEIGGYGYQSVGEAVAAWDQGVESILNNDQWPYAGDLLNGILPKGELAAMFDQALAAYQ